MPHLYFLTDPERTPDPAAAIRQLPAGAAVIYRSFGRPGAIGQGQALRALARGRGLVFLVGADEALAVQLAADGLHLPERWLGRVPGVRRRHRRWLITAAAHSQRATARAGGLALDAALVSVVFATASASAGRPMGPLRFAVLTRGARLPLVALGGVNASTARRLARSGAAGLAAIGGLAES